MARERDAEPRQERGEGAPAAALTLSHNPNPSSSPNPSPKPNPNPNQVLIDCRPRSGAPNVPVLKLLPLIQQMSKTLSEQFPERLENLVEHMAVKLKEAELALQRG